MQVFQKLYIVLYLIFELLGLEALLKKLLLSTLVMAIH